MNPRERKLLNRFRDLPETEAEMLLAFAEFLATRGDAVPAELAKPADVPRPESESVVGALKRLSATYFMLDKAKMLNDTSTVMAQHIMQGRDKVEVIDELEVIFRRHYETLQNEHGKG